MQIISPEQAEAWNAEHRKQMLFALDEIEKSKSDPTQFEATIKGLRSQYGQDAALTNQDWWMDIRGKLKPQDVIVDCVRESDGEASYVILRDGDVIFRRVYAGNPDLRDMDNRQPAALRHRNGKAHR